MSIILTCAMVIIAVIYTILIDHDMKKMREKNKEQ